MKRVLLSALLATTVLPLHASAAPAVGVEQAASADFILRTDGDKAYGVQVLASVPTQAHTSTAPQVRLVVRGPDGTVSRYSALLPASAVTVTAETATLRTSLAGAPLVVRWTLQPYVVVLSFGDAAAAADKDGGWSGAGQGASAQVTLGAARCVVDGWLGKVVAHDSADYGAPVSRALRGTRVATCANPPVTSVP